VRARPRGHAVVLGAGVAGLATARVLADHFDAVTIVERDRLPAEPAGRTGVPQGAHVHGLLARGLREIEALVPGITADLVARGGLVVDLGGQFARLTHAGWLLRTPSGIAGLCASRPLIEWALRVRVLRLGNVRLLDGHAAETLLGDRQRVTAVATRRAGDGPGPVIAADFVVDTTGRGSRAPRWLAALGCPTVPQTVLDARMCYASRHFAIPPGWSAPWRMLYVAPDPPDRPRAAFIGTIEGNRWIVTLQGAGPAAPVADPGSFLAFARTLASPRVAEAIDAAEPLCPVRITRATGNRRWHYGRTQQPDNFVVLGDAACSLNPVYAQGMTVSILSAQLLGQSLAGDGAHPAFATRFQRRLERASDAWWRVCTRGDQRFLTPRPASGRWATVRNRYLARLQAGATRDPQIRRAMLEVSELLRPPRRLASPAIALRAALPARPPAPSSWWPRREHPMDTS